MKRKVAARPRARGIGAAYPRGEKSGASPAAWRRLQRPAACLRREAGRGPRPSARCYQRTDRLEHVHVAEQAEAPVRVINAQPEAFRGWLVVDPAAERHAIARLVIGARARPAPRRCGPALRVAAPQRERDTRHRRGRQRVLEPQRRRRVVLLRLPNSPATVKRLVGIEVSASQPRPTLNVMGSGKDCVVSATWSTRSGVPGSGFPTFWIRSEPESWISRRGSGSKTPRGTDGPPPPCGSSSQCPARARCRRCSPGSPART